jgi:hypothetical protein
MFYCDVFIINTTLLKKQQARIIDPRCGSLCLNHSFIDAEVDGFEKTGNFVSELSPLKA